MIDQAFYTSARTARLTGYQLVACSPGVAEAEARDLAVWGPSHDSLLASGSAAESINFHPLAGSRFAVSQTTPEGPEPSGRGGPRVYTQFLLVDRQTLTRFSNNPFAFWRAALAQGAVGVLDDIAPLKSLELAGHPSPFDERLVGQVVRELGAGAVTAAVQTVLREPQAGFAGKHGPRLMAAVINCLPIECRLQFSLATGLRISSRRPFRWLCLSDDREENRRLARRHSLALVTGEQVEGDECDGWAGHVHQLIASGRLAELALSIKQAPAEVPGAASLLTNLQV